MWILLLTSLSCCRLTVGSPVGRPIQPVNLEACVTRTDALLSSVTKALARDELFKGLNCTEQNIQLSAGTETLTVCAPQNATCPGREFTFDRDACLQNILKDISFYKTALVSHRHYDLILGPTVVKSTAQFMRVCFSNPFISHTTTISTPPEDTFDERLRLCRTLRGLRTRTVTIGRVLRYILNNDKST